MREIERERITNVVVSSFIFREREERERDFMGLIILLNYNIPCIFCHSHYG